MTNLGNLDMFYPPFPTTVQRGQYTFVEPDFSVKFPVFRCCPGHSGDGQQQQQQHAGLVPATASTSTTTMMYNNNNYRNVEQQHQQNLQLQQQQPWQQQQQNVNKQQQNVHFDLAPPTTSSNSSSGFLPFPTARQSLEKREEVDELAMLDEEEEELVPDEPVIDSRQGNWFGDGEEAEEDEFVLLDDPVLIVEEEQPKTRRGNSSGTEPWPYQPCYPSEEDLYGPEIAVLTPPKQVSSQKQRTPLSQRQHQAHADEVVEVGIGMDLGGGGVVPKKEEPMDLEQRQQQQNNNDEALLDDFVLDESRNKAVNCSTFTRPYLVFDVVAKSLANFKKVMEGLRSIHPRGSGIIFCMSKNECEQVTEHLGQNAVQYHMDLSDAARKENHRRWTNNEVPIMCATNAFGKSVDKPDVRFILHHTLPKSLELYEQQCALAGLDRKHAHCVLLYSFNDHLRVWRLIKEDVPKPPPNVLAMKENALRDVLRYAENVSECRRKLLAGHFREKYSSERCQAQPGPCSICELRAEGHPPPQLFDFTREALALLQSMPGLKNLGVAFVADLFRGQLNKKRVKQAVEECHYGRLPMFGLGHGLSDNDCQRFIQQLVIEDYVKLKFVNTRHGTVIGYVEMGPQGAAFLRKYRQAEQVPENERIYMHIEQGRGKRRSSKGVSDLSAFVQVDDHGIGTDTSRLAGGDKRRRVN